MPDFSSAPHCRIITGSIRTGAVEMKSGNCARTRGGNRNGKPTFDDYVHEGNAGALLLPVERLREGEGSARTGLQPERRQAHVGEIACMFSRRYNVPLLSFADQHGLGPYIALRENT